MAVLLEREAELAVLDERIARAAAGEGSLVLVEGAAGIGKTAVLRAATQHAGQRGLQVLSARGAALEGDFPFGVARQLFEPVLRALDDTARAAVTADAAALAEHALGAQPPGGDPAVMSAALHGLYWLCANLSELSPLLVVVDDAHWSDLPSARWLAYVARRLEGLPVAVVVGTRPGARAPVGDLLDALRVETTTIGVAPAALSPAATGQVVAAAYPEPAPAFVAACHMHSGGNPLLLGELLAALRASGLAPDAAGAARLEQDVPSDAARAVRRRIGPLESSATALVRAVAVFEQAPLNDAAALAQLPLPDAAAAADALHASQVLDAGPVLRFRHPLLRSAVYDDVAPAQRAGLHARAAELLRGDPHAAQRVSAHLLAAPAGAVAWASDHLRGAAHTALAGGAPETAARLLRRALDERPPDRAPVLMELARAQIGLAPIDAIATLDEALDFAEARLEAGRLRSFALAAAGRLRESYDQQALVLDELGDGDQELRKVVESDLLAAGLYGPGVEAEVAERIARLPLPTGDTLGDARLLGAIVRYRVLTGAPAAEIAELALRALGPDRPTEPYFDSHVYAGVVSSLTTCERFDQSARLIEAGHAAAARRGSLQLRASALMLSVFPQLRLGRLRDGLALARETADVAEQAGYRLAVPITVAASVLVAIEQGDLDAADGALAAAGLHAGEIPDTYVNLRYLLHVRGRLRLAQGRTAEGIADLRELEQRERAAGQCCADWLWRADLSRALAVAGEIDEARALAEEELAIARRRGTARPQATALRALAAVDGDLELLREAVTILTATPLQLERAHALSELGAALRRQHHRSEAREPLREALDLAHRCGATALANHVDVELRATGARPRSVVLSGVDSLTPSERRIADLAADGMSNVQIAQHLFITRKTVESHLWHIYPKLDISGRDQLAAALSRT